MFRCVATGAGPGREPSRPGRGHGEAAHEAARSSGAARLPARLGGCGL